MGTADLVIKDEHGSENRAPAASEIHTSKFDKRIGPDSDPVSQVRRLDVDAVLARSLAKVAGD